MTNEFYDEDARIPKKLPDFFFFFLILQKRQQSSCDSFDVKRWMPTKEFVLSFLEGSSIPYRGGKKLFRIYKLGDAMHPSQLRTLGGKKNKNYILYNLQGDFRQSAWDPCCCQTNWSTVIQKIYDTNNYFSFYSDVSEIDFLSDVKLHRYSLCNFFHCYQILMIHFLNPFDGLHMFKVMQQTYRKL